VQSDIRWCLLNGLIREAAADVLHARSLDPLDPQTVQLLRQVASRMKQQTNPEGTSKSTDTMPTIGDKPMIQTVSHESPAQEPPLETRHADQQPSIGLSEKSIHEFSAKIQPILMNRCVSCHAKDDPNNRVFKIHSSLTSRWAPKIVADENLRAVMQFVDLAAPANSVIRIKASDGHGGRRHSFGGSGSAMMGNLDRWLSQLQTTAGSQTADYIDTPQASWNEVIDEHEPTNDPLFLTQPPELSPLHSESTSAGPVAIPALPEPIESRSQPWATGAATKSDTPHQMRRMPKVKNPFDPEIFNRRFHGP
ncbi:MAG: hypothetical protein KDB00_23415, partial [Planctomycetales bacterium]|nr:hypothetical protein [Planctomycetales bacterium]